MRKNIIDNINSSVNNSTDHTENYEYMQDFQAMGTTIQLQFNAPKQEWKRIAEKSIRLIDNLEQVMSFYKIDSQISQLNNRAGKEWLSVSPELFFICTEAKRYARLTEGFFDITVAALTEIWQLYGKNEKIPPQSIIENRMKLTNYEGILIDEENKKIKLEKEGQKIDLGGIAKGYAANRVISLYRELGIKSGLVNLGGNVSLLGCHYNGKFWGVGLQNPNNLRGECLGVLLLENTSVVTSGDYERFFSESNKYYHHILDPFTGYPARGGLRSVTIVHQDSMLADVLSTAVFILGMNRGIELIKNFEDVEVIMITDNEIYLSSKIIKSFHLTENCFTVFQI